MSIYTPGINCQSSKCNGYIEGSKSEQTCICYVHNTEISLPLILYRVTDFVCIFSTFYKMM